jgi:hypothetical protein
MHSSTRHWYREVGLCLLMADNPKSHSAILHQSRQTAFRTITLFREGRARQSPYRGVLLCASFSAVSSASPALIFTSGATPVPSQSGLPYGLTGFVSGIPMPK